MDRSLCVSRNPHTTPVQTGRNVEKARPEIGRDAIEAAMSRLPQELHRLLVWLCTGRVPAPEHQKGRAVS